MAMLREKQLKSAKSVIKQRQKTDLQILEESQEKETAELNSIWDDKFHQYRAACKAGEQELKKRQQEFYASEDERLSSTLPVLPKHSSELLNLRKMQELVIRQKEFREAHHLQQKLNELEGECQEKWLEERGEKIKKKLKKVTDAFEQEIQNYRQKAISGFNELKRQKARELNSIERRCSNLKQDMTGQQRIENSQMEMSRRAPLDTEAVSRMMTSRSVSRMATSHSGFFDRATPHASAMGDNGDAELNEDSY